MKSFTVAAALFAASTYAWVPSCAWNDCMGSWDGTDCDQDSGWSCLCSNQTAIAQLNTCVATSCTNATDQETIYGAVAQLCANNGVQVSASQQATFSATSGGSLLAQITDGPSGWGPAGGWNSGDWSSWVSACSGALPGAPSGWSAGAGGNWASWASQNGFTAGGPWTSGGPGGNWGPGGGWGPGGNGGPWGTKASGVLCDGDNSWTTWTGGWGPYSSWTGVWSGCSTTTNTPSPATVTTTVTSGGSTQVLTGTTFGIQALSQTSGADATSASDSDNAGASFVSSRVSLTAAGAVAGSVFALMVML